MTGKLSRIIRLIVIGVAFSVPVVAGQSSQTVRVALPPATKVTYLFPITPGNYETNYNFQVQYIMYKPLLWIGKDITVDYNRSIASSVTTTDGEHYLIKLNPKWHWSDSQPVTSKDVVFFWDLVNSIKAKNASAYYAWGIGGVPQDIASVSALGNYEVEVTLNKPSDPLWFELNGLAQFIPLPEHAWNKYPGDPAKTLAYLQSMGNNIPFMKGSPVDGSFKVDSFEQNREYSFVANPSYDGHKPTYQRLAEYYFTSSDAEFNALLTHAVDVGYLPAHLYNKHVLPGYTFASKPLWGFFYIAVNFANPNVPALKLLPVRQALQMAIDQPAMIKSFFHGQGIAEYGPVPYSPPTYLSPLLKSGAPYKYDPVAGKALLEENGWKMANGVMSKGGMKLEFVLQYGSGSLTRREEAELFAEAAGREGIKINLKPIPYNTLIGELSQPKAWTLAYWGGWTYQPDYFPSGDGLFNTNGGSNMAGYSNPRTDKLIKETTEFHSKREQLLSAMYAYQNYFAKQVVVLSLPLNNQLLEVNSNLTGVIQTYNPTETNWSPQYWSFRPQH